MFKKLIKRVKEESGPRKRESSFLDFRVRGNDESEIKWCTECLNFIGFKVQIAKQYINSLGFNAK